MKKLGIFVFDEVEVLDFAGPFEVFSIANQLSEYKLLEIQIAAEKKTILTKNGLKINADIILKDLFELDYLVLPGGDGTKNVIKELEKLKVLTTFIQTSSWTMSVCSGSRILGKLGFLDQKPYCTHHQVYEEMEVLVSRGVPRRDLRYVQSNEKIWTAAGISAGIDLALHLTNLTFGKELANQVAEYMEYYPYFARK